MPRPPEKLTPEQIEVYDKALEQTNGSWTMAAKAVGVNYETFCRHVKKTASLVAKWGGKSIAALEESEEDPETHRPLVLSPEERKAIAAAKEDNQLKKGLRSFGYSEDQLNELAEVAQLAVGNMESVLDLTIGGMAKSYTDAYLLKQKLHKKLDDVIENPENYELAQTNGMVYQTPHKVMCDLVDRINALGKEMRNMNAAAEQGQITRAKIDEIKRLREEEQKNPKRKPGFSPFGKTTFVQNNYGTPNKKGKKEEKDAEKA